MVEIIVAGDFSPQYRIANILEKEDYDLIFGSIKDIISRSDYAILNLEAPIVSKYAIPIKKTGPNLKTTPKAVCAIKYAGFNCVTLANNHLYDYGEIGVNETFKYLKNSNIDFIGAGNSIKNASFVHYKEIDGAKFAFINCCEYEYSIATESTSGANHLNPIAQYYSIRKAKEIADFVIVIVHGGIEEYQLPTPRMKETYRFFIDIGADVVVNHHQHCYSGYEIYKERPIFYGLGNLSFDWKGRINSTWNQGFLLKLSFNEKISFSLIPYFQGGENAGILLMDTDSEIEFHKKILQLNKIICDDSLLSKEYFMFMDKTVKRQRYVLCPYSNKYLAGLYVRGYLPDCLPLKKFRLLQNMIMCESHRDRFLYFLKNKLK